MRKKKTKHVIHFKYTIRLYIYNFFFKAPLPSPFPPLHPHPTICVMCPVSRVTCHMSHFFYISTGPPRLVCMYIGVIIQKQNRARGRGQMILISSFFLPLLIGTLRSRPPGGTPSVPSPILLTNNDSQRLTSALHIFLICTVFKFVFLGSEVEKM